MKSQKKTRLRVEHLESRCLLSVTAGVFGHTLRITGDRFDNRVAVMELAADVTGVGVTGDIVALGVNSSRVHGGTMVTKDRVRMAVFHNSQINMVQVNLFAGNDVFALGNTAELANMPDGAFENAPHPGIALLTGTIDTVLTSADVATHLTNELASINLVMGGGQDAVCVSGVTTTGNAAIRFGDGGPIGLSDIIGLSSMDAGGNLGINVAHGHATANLAGIKVGRNLVADLNGNRRSLQVLDMTDTTVSGNASIDTGVGEGRVGLGATAGVTVAGKLSIHTHGKLSQVALDTVDTGSLGVNLGGRKDTLDATSLTVTGLARFVGNRNAKATIAAATSNFGTLDHSRFHGTFDLA